MLQVPTGAVDPGAPDATGKRGVHIAVVVVGVAGQRSPESSDGFHGGAVAGAGEEAHFVSGVDEMPRDRQQRGHVAVDRCAADEHR